MYASDQVDMTAEELYTKVKLLKSIATSIYLTTPVEDFPKLLDSPNMFLVKMVKDYYKGKEEIINLKETLK